MVKRHPLGRHALKAVESKDQAAFQLGREIATIMRTGRSGYPRGSQIRCPRKIVAWPTCPDLETVYKTPIPTGGQKILADRGKHFDPEVVDAFLAHESTFRSIREDMFHDEAPEEQAEQSSGM